MLDLQLSATGKRLAGLGRVFQHEVGDECEEVAKLRSAGTNCRYYATHPRKRHKQRSLMTLWSDRQLLEEIQPEQTRKLLNSILKVIVVLRGAPPPFSLMNLTHLDG